MCADRSFGSATCCSRRSSALVRSSDLFKWGWHGGGDIFVLDLCPRARSLRCCSLQRRSGAREGFQERVQMPVCGCDNWKMVNLVLGLWMDADISCFLLRHRRTRVQDLEFDGVSGSCCHGLILSTAMALPLAGYLGDPQSC